MKTVVQFEAGDTVSFDWRVDSSDYPPYCGHAFHLTEIA